jgi:hypothetical protein
MDLFDKVVKPILLYDCEIWGFSCLSLIERLHLKFCKYILNLSSSTPNVIGYGVSGIPHTTIPRDKLKTRLLGIIDSYFFNKKGKMKYAYLVVNHSSTYFVIHDSDSMHKYSEVDIKEILGFLIDNIFVVFGNHIFQQAVEFPLVPNVPLC